MKNNASLIYNLFLIVGDFLALVVAFVAAYLIRGQLSSVPVAHPIGASSYLSVFLVLAPFWILIFALLGLYNSSIYEKRFQELGRLLIGSFIGLLFVLSYAYISNDVIFPAKRVPIYGFGLAFLLLVLFRNLAREFRIWLFRYNTGITNLLIVGDTKVSKELVDALAESHRSGYRILGVVGVKAPDKEGYPHIPAFESFEQAVSKLKVADIHSIVQTELFASGQKNNEILEFAQSNHIAFRFVPGNSELFVGNISVELFRSSVPVIAVHQTPLIGWGRIVKRVTDIGLSIFFLIPGIPLMLIISVIMKLFDPFGPVIYKDPRLTRFGTIIKVYKFRSLKKAYSGLLPEQAFAKMDKPELAKVYRENGDYIQNDPRISRIGGFLRRTSLDELPQLFNILKGDISFVGPRALNSFELSKFDKKDLILAVKSGLTGLAQVSGRRDLSFAERRKLDLYYVQNWSFWMDLVILVKTIKVVLQSDRSQRG
jgi:exopolysaccharide biosynthesis polyprenyl glycosylphosphotransferase